MDLLVLFTSAPRLPQAACRGLSAEFDERHEGEHQADADHRFNAAIRVCQQCPELIRCRAWFDSLAPQDRPPGVVAGVIHRPPVRHQRRAAS